jgi:preprotein translocase subunit SecA
MFEELGAGIREEVVFTLFHAEIEPADAAALEQNQQAQNGNLQYAHETAAGAEAIAAAGGSSVAGAAALGLGGSTSTMTPQTVVASEHEKIGRNDPCWCGSGKKFKKCHGA